MKKIDKSLLFELLRDSKRSDRELAKVLGVSQPTVTRRRSKLVRDGVIREFTIIPDLVKMGYELMAISCVKLRNPVTPEFVEEHREWMLKSPNIIFLGNAEGMGKNGVMISVHKSYTDYTEFVGQQLSYWGKYIQDHDTMLVSLEGTIVKPLSLRYLAEEKSSED